MYEITVLGPKTKHLRFLSKMSRMGELKMPRTCELILFITKFSTIFVDDKYRLSNSSSAVGDFRSDK